MIDFMLNDTGFETGGDHAVFCTLWIEIVYRDFGSTGYHAHPVRHGKAAFTARFFAMAQFDNRIDHVQQAMVFAGALAGAAVHNNYAAVISDLRCGNTYTADAGTHGFFKPDQFSREIWTEV